jgi:hypothetical protein
MLTSVGAIMFIGMNWEFFNMLKKDKKNKSINSTTPLLKNDNIEEINIKNDKDVPIESKPHIKNYDYLKYIIWSK